MTNPSEDPASQTAFGFVVSQTSTDCVPSWGTYYNLTQADGAPLDLSNIFRQMKGDGEIPIISFGGEANTTLAEACTSEPALEAAYREVLNHYGMLSSQGVIDLDIEGAAQGDTAALIRQAAALHNVQVAATASGGTLGVWLTLPSTTQGLLPVAENVVKTMLSGGVQLSGVNVMTMYFSPSPGDGAPMLGAVESALRATHTQLGAMFSSDGLALTSPALWEHEGATVQIGDAGVPGQAFTVPDAQGLVQFAQTVGLGRVSVWSINQDQPCAGGATGGYSTYCSNVAQVPLAFDDAFASLKGSALGTPLLPSVAGSGTTGTVSGTGTTSTVSGTTGSYPAWSSLAAYPSGYKVLVGTTVFEAKWWNKGQRPTTNPPEPWDSPWSVAGSVPVGTQPWAPQTLPPGTYPAWSPANVYTAGMKVLSQGLPYEAKWWTKGTVPSSTWPSTGGSPWQPSWTVPGEPPAS